MLRPTILFAALMCSITLAPAQTSQADQALAQTRDSSEAASANTGPRKDAPFPDMMQAWEYSAQEWQ